jgi:hypothetical protein
MNIQKYLHNYIINNRSDKFTLSDIEKSTDAAIPRRKIEDYLEESQYLFTSSTKNMPEKYYIPRNNFFHKAAFKITPTALEIKKGILFSGHRFIPFYPQELYPTESFQIKTESGSIIKTKDIKNKLEDLYYYYSLLGAEGIIDNITADNTDNIKLIGNPSKKVNITVFDFAKFYNEHSFTEGMSLKFTVENWNNGIFSVAIDNDIIKDEEKYKWFEALEEGLFKLFEETGPYLEIPEQLALGFYNSGPSILKSPPCPINDFINNSEKIQIKFFENNTILWHPEEFTTPTADSNDLVSISQGTIESLDAILEELGLLVSSVEIEAFIRDSLLTGNDSLTSVQYKIFSESEIKFKDKAQEVVFHNNLEELWEDVTANYNKEIDSKNALLRKEILDNLETLYNWYNDSVEQIKKKSALLETEMATLHNNTNKIKGILDTLNKNQSDIDIEDVEKLDELIFKCLKKMNESVDNISTQID